MSRDDLNVIISSSPLLVWEEVLCSLTACPAWKQLGIIDILQELHA